MATENIRIDYNVDKDELAAANKALEEQIKLNGLTQKEVEETNDKFEDQEKQLSKTNKAFSGLGGQLTAIGNKFQIAGKGVGDMAVSMFKATNATSATSKAMKVLKIAVASTGIGLLVVALGSLVTYFTKSQKGSDQLTKAMSAFGAVVDTVLGRLSNIGEGLAAIFNRDFVRGADLLKNSFAGIGEEIKGAVKGSNEYEAAVIRLRKAEIKSTEEVAKRSRIIQDLLLSTRDGTLTLRQEQEALEKIEKLQIQNQLQLTDIAQQKLELAEQDLKNDPESLRNDEKLLAIAQAKAALETEIANEKARQRDTANRQKELNARILIITRSQAAEEAKISKIKEAERQARIDDEREIKEMVHGLVEREREANAALAMLRVESFQDLMSIEEQRREYLLSNEDLLASERELIIEESEARIRDLKIKHAEETANKQKEIDQESAQARIQLQEAAFEITSMIQTAITDNRKANLDKQISDIEKQKAYEIKLAGGNEDLIRIIEEGADKDIARLRRKQAKRERNVALINSSINTSSAILKGISMYGPPPSPAGIASIIAASAIGLTQKAIILSQPLPEFEKGGRIGGNLHSGGGTVIEAERDEFVMSRKATAKYGFDMMNKINNLELNDLSPIIEGGTVNVIDTKAIAEQLKNMPQNIMNIDKYGFELHQRRGQNMLNQKVRRYSTS